MNPANTDQLTLDLIKQFSYGMIHAIESKPFVHITERNRMGSIFNQNINKFWEEGRKILNSGHSENSPLFKSKLLEFWNKLKELNSLFKLDMVFPL